MSVHIVLDTIWDQPLCDWCEEPILGAEMVVYGVGSTNYLKTYHPACEQAQMQWIDNLD